jgi:fatty acid desaturase (delta-4 desaturase)
VVVQVGDIKGLLDNRTQGASLYGATQAEKATVIGGKLAHYGEYEHLRLATHLGAMP